MNHRASVPIEAVRFLARFLVTTVMETWLHSDEIELGEEFPKLENVKF